MRHSAQYVINNPTWPTEWKQLGVLLAHEHWLQSGDLSFLDRAAFELLRNDTMVNYIRSGDAAASVVEGGDESVDLVDFSGDVALPRVGVSPLCHHSDGDYPEGVGDGGRSVRFSFFHAPD